MCDNQKCKYLRQLYAISITLFRTSSMFTRRMAQVSVQWQNWPTRSTIVRTQRDTSQKPTTFYVFKKDQIYELTKRLYINNCYLCKVDLNYHAVVS